MSRVDDTEMDNSVNASPHQGLPLHQDAQAYEHLLDQIAQRRLDGLALLWLSGHQPLAFIAGQLCWLLAPLALLCGWSQVETWAAILSAPHSGARLARDLNQRHKLAS